MTRITHICLAVLLLGQGAVLLSAETPKKIGAQQRMDENLPPFPKPDPEAAFSELKVWDEQGRFYRIPQEDWAGGRQLIAEDSAWADWLQKKRKKLDAWMAERRDYVEWPCGYAHQYVHPRTGAYLPYSPDVPGEFIQVPGQEPVAVNDDIRAAWVNRFRKDHMAQILEAARMYRLTGEETYRDWAVGQMDFYADNYADFVPYSGSPVRVGQLFGNQLNDATMTVVLAQAARLLWDDISPEKRTAWGEKLFYPGVRLQQKYPFACPHNISCWQLSMIGLVAMLYDDEALWDYAIAGKRGISVQLRRGVTSDYLWFEQSMGYNLYVTEALTSFFREAAIQGRMEDIRDEVAIYENLFLSPLQLRFPNGMLPNLADVTGRTTTGSIRKRLADVADFIPTYAGLEYASRRQDWSQLIDPVSAPDGGTAYPTVVSKALASTEVAVLKQGPWQVFFQYGQLDYNHSQREALSYEAMYDTIPITLNPGTAPYGSPLYLDYYRAGMGDNAPLVDGSPQEGWRRGRLLEFSSEPASVSGGQFPFGSGYNAVRTFTIDGDRLVDELTLTPEDTEATQPRTLGFMLHLENPGRLEAVDGMTPVEGFATDRAKGYQHWKRVLSRDVVDEIRLTVVYGPKTFELVIRTKGPFRIYTAQAPGKPPQVRTVIMVEKGAVTADFSTEWIPVVNRSR